MTNDLRPKDEAELAKRTVFQAERVAKVPRPQDRRVRLTTGGQ